MPAHQLKTCTLVFVFLISMGLFTRCAEADTTLNVGTATFSVNHANNSISPSDQSIYVGDTITETFPATLTTSGTNAAGKECTVDSASWSWSIVSVTYSRDGSTFSADSYRPSIGGSATGVMTATFPSDVNHPPGFWKITAHVHVDIVSSTCPNNPLDQGVGPYGFSVARGDFGLTATPNPLTVLLGGSGVETVTVTPLAGFYGTVNLSLFGAPTGITGDAFSVSPVYPNPVQRGYNVYVAETATPGSYPVFVSGTTGLFGHSAPLTVTVPPRTASVLSGFGTTTRNDGNGNPVANDPKVEVDTLISTAKISQGNGQYIREKLGTYTCTATGFLPGFTYWWGSTVGGSMGIDTPNSSSNWFAESTSNGTISIMSSSNSDAYPQTTTASCIVRNAGSSYSVTTNTITVNWHWPYEGLRSSNLPATRDDTEPLGDVAPKEISSPTDPANPGYTRPGGSISYDIAPKPPLISWFFRNSDNFVDLAALMSDQEVAVAAAKLAVPEPPADLISSISDSPSGLDFHQACLVTATDEKTNNSGDYRIDPPTYADSCPDPQKDPQGLQRFASQFLHTLKIKRYFTIYHYIGDKYGATGYTGTLPTNLKSQTGFDSPSNYYKFAQY